MTRYKKYAQEKGFKLDKDFDFMPYEDLQGVTIELCKDGIMIKYYYLPITIIYTISRQGNVSDDCL